MAAVASVWRHRGLVFNLVRRDVIGRYRGSTLGLLWSFLNPILMLLVYTFVFSVVFRARWGLGEDESRAQFAVVLFAGLIVHGLFSEVVNRAPGIILANANFVKRVVFPLEILPVVALGGALFHAFVSVFILLAGYTIVSGPPHWTALLFPVVFLPLAVLTLGLGWILAALGVYLRDIAQAVGVLTTALLFLSPIFFPMSALPAAYHPLILANPLTFIIEQAREVLIWGRVPDWQGLAQYTAVALACSALGFAWFQRTRKGFADVV
jgi:lipopolysaccharide transport system permease protein